MPFNFLRGEFLHNPPSSNPAVLIMVTKVVVRGRRKTCCFMALNENLHHLECFLPLVNDDPNQPLGSVPGAGTDPLADATIRRHITAASPSHTAELPARTNPFTLIVGVSMVRRMSVCSRQVAVVCFSRAHLADIDGKLLPLIKKYPTSLVALRVIFSGPILYLRRHGSGIFSCLYTLDS
eukprot:superscaffoldBa00000910_g7942